jgi:hypothetical protein
MSIAGFEYQRFWTEREAEPQLWDQTLRTAWRAKQRPLDAGPYEHLAAVYRNRGMPQRAEAIQVALLRRERGAQRWQRRLLGRLWDLLTLYGFRPWRVVVLTAALILGLSILLSSSTTQDSMRATGASGTVYAPDGPIDGPSKEPTCGGDVRCFRPVIYSIDIVIPLVDLGQRTTWRADPHDHPGTAIEAIVTICTLLGWALSTLFALSFTRIARAN